MWLYLLGPFLALLPRRWRRALPFHNAVRWGFASVISGLAEALLALVALMAWYSYSVTTWVSHMLDHALSQSAPTGITDHEVGFVALLIWATHPLTWVLAYIGVEGSVRLCAYFSDTVLGLLPLYLVDKLYCKIAGVQGALPPGTPQFAHGHASSYVSTVRDKLVNKALPGLADALFFSTVNADELLEIHAVQPKPDWDSPRVVRFQDRYYRLEETAKGSAPRRYVYRLRRLPAGVPGRTVLVYQPSETIVASH